MTVGFVGLGHMGGPICRNLAGTIRDQVVFFDRDTSAIDACRGSGGRAASGIADLSRESDVVFLCLPHPTAMTSVCLDGHGILGHARPGTTVIDLSTNAPSTIRPVGSALADRGIALLDAPMSGGPDRAESGALTIMVGGDESLYQEHLHLLEVFSSNQFYMGPQGSGAVAKIVNNLLSIANMTTAAEGLMLAAAAGVDLAQFDQVVRVSSGDSTGYRLLADHALQGDYTPTMALEVAYKDICLAHELAEQFRVATPHAAQAANLMRMALAQGFGALDPSVVFRVYADGRTSGDAADTPDQ